MALQDDFLDSWDRQCEILASVASLLTDANKHFRPSPDSWTIDRHLAHLHNTRTYFLSQVAPDLAADLKTIKDEDEVSLEEIRTALEVSGRAIREVISTGLEAGGPLSGGYVTYENPVLLLQHMVWHEGWHVGLIFLALRINGQEPPEEWEEPNVWGKWRTETWE